MPGQYDVGGQCPRQCDSPQNKKRSSAIAAATCRLLPGAGSGKTESIARRVIDLVKSHLSGAIIRSEDERAAIDVLEDMDEVEFFAPNSRKIGMTIPYRFNDAPHRYEPDFVVRLMGGTTLVLEIKGVAGLVHGDDDNRVEAKKAAAEKWMTAVNNSGRDGRWAYVYCDQISRLRDQVLAHVPVTLAQAMPFRRVAATPAGYFRTCVPLTSFRSLAAHLESDQLSLDELAAAAHGWITWDGHPPFSEGMFVARVSGRAMEPDIADGTYCLFDAAGPADRNGRRLLVFHNAIKGKDPVTGGPYTLRTYHSERAIDGSEGWRHVKVTLRAINPTFEPIVFTATEETDVWVIGELIATVGRSPGRSQ